MKRAGTSVVSRVSLVHLVVGGLGYSGSSYIFNSGLVLERQFVYTQYCIFCLLVSIMVDRASQVQIGENRLRSAIGLHKNSLETIKALKVHSKAATKAIRV